MSDLSIPLAARSRTQLPARSYFDEALFRSEQERIFSHAPRYLSHELSLPEVGSYVALPQEQEGRALVRARPAAAGDSGVELISNVCRHRQALMLKGRGNTGSHVVCPLHRWTYDTSGKLVGAPQFAQDPCLHLQRSKVQSWNGLLFEHDGQMHSASQDLSSVKANVADFDFSGYVFHKAIQHHCHYNWKTFVEVYLEDYHVGPFHPGLGGFVTCDDLKWEWGPHHSVQTVGVNRGLEQAGSPVYKRWHESVQRFRGGVPPAHGAVWFTYYPTTMLEWYPHVLVVSSLHPRGPRSTLNLVEFFYPEEIVAFEPDFIAAQQAAYMETCAEDDEIAERMDAGRAALLARGDDDAGPYQSPLEDGMQHFHAWYRREMGDGAQLASPAVV